jgi:hypothetical protein
MNQAGLARKWKIARSRVTQYKSEGMPVDSEESAFAWIAMNYPDRACEIMGSEKQPIETNAPLPGNPSAKETRTKDLSVVVARMGKNENVAWKMLDDAINKSDIARIQTFTKHYNAASAARLQSEKEYAEYKIKTGELISASEAIELLGMILSPIKTMLSALAFSCASRANPTDPDLAREAIAAETEKMKANIRSELEKMMEALP